MNYKWIRVWLYAGLVLVFFQIVIGGVTRLTGSGLSITKWEIITGTLPPLNSQDWNEAFDLYKETPQYLKINEGMTMAQFKFIYFWEYFHRLWARIMGFVFIVPFLFFAWRRMLGRTLMKDLGIVIILAMVAASFGWIMVASGLIDRPWVNAYKLSIHLLIGMSVYGYLFWTILKFEGLSTSKIEQSNNAKLLRLLHGFFALLFVQLFFGGILSGLKAAIVYPTWPLIGPDFLPPVIFDLSNWNLQSFTEYEKSSFVYALVHFVHRTCGYLLVLGWFVLWFYMRKFSGGVFKSSLVYLGVAICVQIVLGIITLFNSVGTIPVLWGSLHQIGAIAVLTFFLMHYYLVSSSLKKG